MVSAIFFTLTFLVLIQSPQNVGDEFDAVMHERMQQRAEELEEHMMQLLLEMEQRDQENSWEHAGALLLSALQHWQFWALTGELVFFFVLCRMLRKPCHELCNRNEKGISRNKEDDDTEEEPSDILDARIFVSGYLQWPMRNLEETCKFVEELVDKLLCVCQTFPKNKFMPRLQPPIGVGSAFSASENNAIYHLLVPLNPTPGHTFHLELGTKGQTPARNSCLCMELQCMCTRERLVGDMLCILHHPEDELRHHDSSFLDTLCSGSYLDVQKTAKWFQELVTEAWVAMPQSSKLQLMVLPSTRFCKLRLTNILKKTLFIELMLGVQQDNSDTFLSFE
ncbi:inositol 1,4,5-trisphosphate receptor-interacting protein-like 1 [Anser cygnoides]|uniref:Inositol 1,4,5-trisphosphate receptor-interacting protein-like 1 n=1 Tax=Anser cygnoides TaxID=8845 RepID=A0A8B9DDP7_ANSCY